MEEREYIDLNFGYTSTFGDETQVNKRYYLIDGDSDFEIIVEEFKKFLINCGYHPESVNKIQIIEEE